LITSRVPDPDGYGRVIRAEDGSVDRIVEHRDATLEEREVDEVNAGFYVFDLDALRELIGSIGSDNAQGEHYLPDVISLLRRRGERVTAVRAGLDEVRGVNDRMQLAEAGVLLRRRTCMRWMEEGVTVIDPSSVHIDPTVSLEADVVIQPFTFLEGNTVIQAGAVVGPQSRVVDSRIGEGATVSFSVVVSSEIGASASVGPFASLRPGTVMKADSKIGTFVETKNTVIGEGSKANHLSYLGDARLGRRVNVGAGTITCNWDGIAKHETIIDDDVYVSSDTMLVAPVHLGERSATGAGSVVRKDVPAGSLAVGAPARIIEGKGNRIQNRGDGKENDGQDERQ
jgi:bifunctional UDP-N-acetylglucosamine pyrophosphorylase/glucosamine-1-phosphate N-acetyltransferase